MALGFFGRLFHAHDWAVVVNKPCDVTLVETTRTYGIETDREERVVQGCAVIEKCSDPRCGLERAYLATVRCKQEIEPTYVRARFLSEE